MTPQTVTLELPKPLYQRLWQKSQRQQRTVVEELYRLTDAELDESISDGIDQQLLLLKMLPDDALWSTARASVDQDKQIRMHELFDKRNRLGDLSELESAELQSIIDLGSHVTLIRAEAAVLLKERGYDISELGPKGS